MTQDKIEETIKHDIKTYINELARNMHGDAASGYESDIVIARNLMNKKMKKKKEMLKSEVNKSDLIKILSDVKLEMNMVKNKAENQPTL